MHSLLDAGYFTLRGAPQLFASVAFFGYTDFNRTDYVSCAACDVISIIFLPILISLNSNSKIKGFISFISPTFLAFYEVFLSHLMCTACLQVYLILILSSLFYSPLFDSGLTLQITGANGAQRNLHPS